MGDTVKQQHKAYGLVSMVNGDAYYIDERTAGRLQKGLSAIRQTNTQTMVDARSGATVILQVKNISSVVVFGVSRG